MRHDGAARHANGAWKASAPLRNNEVDEELRTVNEGLTSWQKPGNHGKLVQLQSGVTAKANAAVEIAYFGHSAVRITSQSGISVLIDPWRNHPAGEDWFFHDFPMMAVDIGICTHAHFDHDALHRLDASMLIDRLIGCYHLADIAVTGFADCHAGSTIAAEERAAEEESSYKGRSVLPPDNRRSRDNCMLLVETGGLRLLHWGDNRAELPDHLWGLLTDVDVLFLPMDDSQHIISYKMIEDILARLSPKITVPIHYYIDGVTRKESSLMSPEKWLTTKGNILRLKEPLVNISSEALKNLSASFYYFGNNVAFDARSRQGLT